jgi:hypothetical protein
MDYRELFPARYAGGKNLPGAGLLVEVQAVGKEKMRAGPSKPEEVKAVMIVKRIAGPHPVGVAITRECFGIVLRKKLCEQIAGIVGSNETDDWKGKRVVLYPCETKAAGEVVQSICARTPKQQPTETTASEASNE